MSRWWRAYDDALTNPKLQNLSPATFRCWFNLLCVASKNGGVIPSCSELVGVLKLPTRHLLAHLKTLTESGLIDPIEGGYVPHNWMKRQYKSDFSKERTKRYRAKSVTAPDTDTDTDTEKNKKDRESRAKARSSRKTRLPEDWWPSDEGLDYARTTLSLEQADIEAQRFRDYWRGCGRPMADWEAVWRNWVRRAPDFRPRPPPTEILTRKQSNAQKLEKVLERLHEYSEETGSSSGETPLRLVSSNSGNGRP